MAALSAGAVRPLLEGPLREEDPGSLAQREIPRALPEASAGGGVSAATLQRRSRGTSLPRSPHTAIQTANAEPGRDDRALYQPHPRPPL